MARSTRMLFPMIALVLVLVLVLAGCCCGVPAGTRENTRITIGVFSQPASGSLSRLGDQYIAASYIKYVEAAGAQAVPIRFDEPEPVLRQIFESVNGLLLPGGGVALGNNIYTTNYQKLISWAIEANDAGDVFPVWGTCFGFQEIVMAVGGSLDLLSATNSENLTLPLQFTPAAKSSALFGPSAPAEVLDILADPTKNVTMNNHHWSLLPDTFANTPKLNAFFNVLSTNVDRNGIEFISTIEAKHYPIAASQWHPEKVMFEPNPGEVTKHTTDAVRAMLYVDQFFVALARSSFHKFPSPQAEAAALIYNWEPVYTFDIIPDFVQCYFFKNAQ